LRFSQREIPPSPNSQGPCARSLAWIPTSRWPAQASRWTRACSSTGHASSARATSILNSKFYI
jgi:hypothetical protein